MKNHKKINGKLIQTNKTWSHLKERQKELISTMLQTGYQRLWLENKRIPSKMEIEKLLSIVYEEIEKREIWIPFYEVKAYFSKKKHKWNLQSQKKIESLKSEKEEG